MTDHRDTVAPSPQQPTKEALLDQAMAEIDRLGSQSFPGTGSDITIRIGRLRTIISASLTAATDKARREAIEECAHFVESGIFLTDSSPAYHFANECAAAIRRALTPQNPGDAEAQEGA